MKGITMLVDTEKSISDHLIQELMSLIENRLNENLTIQVNLFNENDLAEAMISKIASIDFNKQKKDKTIIKALDFIEGLCGSPKKANFGLNLLSKIEAINSGELEQKTAERLQTAVRIVQQYIDNGDLVWINQRGFEKFKPLFIILKNI